MERSTSPLYTYCSTISAPLALHAEPILPTSLFFSTVERKATRRVQPAIRALRFQAEGPLHWEYQRTRDGLARAAYSVLNRAEITNPGQGICNREDCALRVWHTTGPCYAPLGQSRDWLTGWLSE
jgi:hypothetical protein